MGAGLMLGEMAGLFARLIAQQEESTYAQADARENARLAKVAEADALQRGYREAGLARMAGSQLVAEQKVAAAASGADPSVGTPAQVAGSTRAIAELDALTLQNNAARESWGFGQKAERYQRAAEHEKRALPLRQFGSVLTSAGRLSGGYGRGG
jgi:hypothetical protein